MLGFEQSKCYFHGSTQEPLTRASTHLAILEKSSSISLSEKDGAGWKNNLGDPSHSKCLLFSVLDIGWVSCSLGGGGFCQKFQRQGLISCSSGVTSPVLSLQGLDGGVRGQ